MVFLTISRELECSYCVAAHTAFAQTGQVDGNVINQLREGNLLEDPKLDGLQHFVSNLVQSNGNLSEQEIADFLALDFNRRNILVIITMLPNKLMAVYVNRIMGTELDEALQPAI